MFTIITWNVNGIRAAHRKNALASLLDQYSPDVLLLNEIKGTIDKFPPEIVSPMFYQAFYHSAEKPGYAGTGIWVKQDKDIELIRFSSGVDNRKDHEGRAAHTEIAVKGKPMHIIGCYFPNGGKSTEAFEDKLVFYEDFLNMVNRLRSKEKKKCHLGW